MSPVFFFVLAMFLLASAVIASGVDRRFALWLLSVAGNEPRRVLLALMVGSAAVSTVMSDLVACALFATVGAGVLDRAGVRPGSSFGRAVMLGIPIACFIGGVATPAGSSVNILGIHFIQEYGNIRVPFLSWTVIGVPMVIGLLPVAWWAVLRSNPPEIAAVGDAAAVNQERTALGPLRSSEKKILALFALLIALWTAGTWIEQLEVPVVALAGAMVLFFPGVELLTWRQAQEGVGWEALLMIGGVTSLGAVSVVTGLAQWLVHAALGGLAGWSPVWLIAAVSAFTVVVHLAIPIAPVINSVLIPPIVLLALDAGRNPALYAVPVAFTASCAFLLPLDAVSLLTYSRGYYRMLDMVRPGVLVSVAWVILMTALLLLLGPALGFL
jgi:sodium-dependent dicarboxylate transporter 2/3/5